MKKLRIQKRDGRLVDFDEDKIVNAIEKANNTVSPICRLNDAQIAFIAADIRCKVEPSGFVPTVEGIQDMVEIGLMEMRGYEVAQKYIRYRYKRELERAGKEAGGTKAISSDHKDEIIHGLIDVLSAGREREYVRDDILDAMSEEDAALYALDIIEEV